MKKFLSALEKELKKLKISSSEIAEILRDHAEMIESALSEGVSEEELSLKFGNPEKLARELYEDYKNIDMGINLNGDYEVEEELKGYELFKSFMVVDNELEVQIGMVSEDVTLYSHNGDSIEVYIKGSNERYESKYEDGVFQLRTVKKISFFIGRKSVKFIVRIPKNVAIGLFSYSTTSGDSSIKGISSNEAKFNAVSGDLSLEDIESKHVKFNTVSGDVEMNRLKASELSLKSVSGDFNVENVSVERDLNLKSISGDFEFNNVVSQSAKYNSISGDLNAKEFYSDEISIKSLSGDVSIHNLDESRIMNVISKKTTSGDVKINGTKVK